MRRLAGIVACLTLVGVALGMVGWAAEASAGTPQTYSNYAYDYTQATPWPPSGSTEKIPLVYFTSYYATTMNTNTLYYHSPEIVNAYETEAGIQVSTGQTVGVICYSWDTAGHLFDKIDARFSGNPARNWSISVTGSNLWIGYVLDTYVNLTYADRINYVPKCAGSAYTPSTSSATITGDPNALYAIREGY